jgi:hypothetical protein
MAQNVAKFTHTAWLRYICLVIVVSSFLAHLAVHFYFREQYSACALTSLTLSHTAPYLPVNFYFREQYSARALTLSRVYTR